MTRRIIRIGQIVPSSNTTMETEVPEFLNSMERATQGHRILISFISHANEACAAGRIGHYGR